MKEKKLSSSLQMIAFGMLFTVAHLKINGFDILVDWVGYLLIFIGLMPVVKDSKYASVIKIIGIIATGWSLIGWVCAFAGISLDNVITTIIFTLVYAAYYFIFITAIAFCTKDESRQNRIRLSAIINTVLHVVTSVIAFIPPLHAVSFVLIFVNLAVRIWICAEIFLLASSIKKEEEQSLYEEADCSSNSTQDSDNYI